MVHGAENGRWSRTLLPWALPLLLVSSKSYEDDSGPDQRDSGLVPAAEDLDPRALDILAQALSGHRACLR